MKWKFVPNVLDVIVKEFVLPKLLQVHLKDNDVMDNK
jgi:hypothetical protein